ncbi:hypothetical protein AOY38_13835 [Synechocystis sp. PCC 6803]|nr:hypothetical protein AOY38_13835 [Synechocystis sp. PCC 6803]
MSSNWQKIVTIFKGVGFSAPLLLFVRSNRWLVEKVYMLGNAEGRFYYHHKQPGRIRIPMAHLGKNPKFKKATK